MELYLSPLSAGFAPHAHIRIPENLANMDITPWQAPHWKEKGLENEVSAWSVNSFDESIMHVVPVPFEEPWETIALHAAREGSELVMGIFPAHVQMVQRLNHGLHAAKLPLVYLPTAQLSALPAIAAQVHIGGLIIPAHDIALVPRALDAAHLYVQAVHDMASKPLFHSENAMRIYNEVHLVPGIVAFFQCEPLAAARRGEFHPSDRFVWELSDRIRVTDYRGRFVRLELPHSFAVSEKKCACGRNITISYL